MGKATLYHPVSLHVIRGSAEYCGFRFGKLRQTDTKPEEKRAWYVAEVVDFPGGLNPAKASVQTLKGALRKCFNDDIAVTGLWVTRQGRYWAQLDVQLNRVPESPKLFEGAVQ